MATSDNDFEKYKKYVLNTYDSNLKDWKLFEIFCAEEIIPRLHPEYIFDEIEEILTPKNKKSVDIFYKNIFAHCKYEDIIKTDDALLICSNFENYLLKELSKTGSKRKILHIYLFCKTLSNSARYILLKKMQKIQIRGINVEFKCFEINDLQKVYREINTNKNIKLLVSVYHNSKDARESNVQE